MQPDVSRHWSRQAGLAVVAMVFLVTLVAVLGAWQVVSAVSSQRDEARDGEVNAAHLASSALGSAISSRMQELTTLASDTALALLFQETPKQSAQSAASLHILYPGYASIDLVGADGRLQARWPPDPGVVGESALGVPSLAGALHTGKPSMSQAFQQTAAPKELVVLLAAPVHDKAGRVAGVIAASLAGSSLGKLVGGTTLRDGASLVIFDRDGHALTGPASGARVSYRALPAVRQGLQGKAGATTGAVPGYGSGRIVGYAPVPSTGWVAVVEQPTSQLNAQARGLTERLVAIGVVVLLLAVGTTLLLASLLRRLSRERERTGALVASLGEGVVVVDPDGVVQLANPAMAQLTGRPVEALAGSHWSDVMSLCDGDGHPIAWERSMAAEAARQRQVVATSGYELYLGHLDGRRVPIAMTAAPLVSGAEFLGTVLVLRDVSREREVDQLKSSLVSTVSHELRTPLTMVQGFAELLATRGTELGPQRSREAAGQILRSAQRLGRLIDDLLSVSRIDSGKVRVDIAAVNLTDVLDEVARVAGSRSGPEDGASAEARLRIDLPTRLPLVMADYDKLVQVLLNLVTNALKYSSEDQSVHVTAKAKDDQLEIAVVDSGIGMTPAECATIFEKFSRADRAEVRKVGGTGLGLYITKNLVELQHGRLWVESQVGRGSSFFVSLPTVPPAMPREGAEAGSVKEVS